MDQMPDTDYKKVLTEVIKKQMMILGPAITLVKARSVPGLTVADDGTVINIQGSPQVLIQGLIDQFVQLSGLIVKKTMEPLLSIYPTGVAATPQIQPAPPSPQAAPAQTTPLTNDIKNVQNDNTQPKV